MSDNNNEKLFQNFATVGLILGLLSGGLIFSVPMIAPILSFFGVITSVRGLNSKEKKVWAIVGCVLNSLGFLAVCLLLGLDTIKS